MFSLVILLAAVVVGVVGFILWAIVRSIDFVVRLLRGPAAAPQAGPAVEPMVRCRQGGCHAANAPHARFCRRCGSPTQAGLVAPRWTAPARPPQQQTPLRLADLV